MFVGWLKTFLRRGFVLALFSGIIPVSQPGYTGICDTLSGGCAEAWSVTHALTRSYSGPLFQLWDGGTTFIDIQQDANHTAVIPGNLATTCGGLVTNCRYSLVYAQIQGHANDWAQFQGPPSSFAGGHAPNCPAESPPGCYTFFAIDSTSGLPIMNIGTGQEYTLTPTSGPNYDPDITGVTAGTASFSEIFVGQPIATTAYCCGPIGLSHNYNTGNSGPSSSLQLTLGYGNTLNLACGSSTNYCFGTDGEGVTGGPYPVPVDYSTTLLANVVMEIGHDNGLQKINGFINDKQGFNFTILNTALDTGKAIHIGGGGDLSQPAPVIVRDFAITNNPIAQADVDAIFANVKAFYPALSFPTPPLL